MDKEQLVTVNLLSYNRKDELRNTLTKIYEQDYKNIEVIVVDNASSDGTQEAVKKEFPDVKLISLNKNIGITGWNKGFEVAKGKYVLVLDDDSYPDAGTIKKAIKCIEFDERIAVLYLPIFNLRYKKYEGGNINIKKPHTFIGCGVLIKSEVIREVGMYSGLLFLYEHETEFCMRVLNEGYIIKYCPDALVFHENSLRNRKIKNKIDSRKTYFISRNYLIILFLHFSIKRFLLFAPQLIIARTISALFGGDIYPTVKGFISSFFLLPKLIGNRFVLRDEIQRFYKYGNYMGRFVVEKK